VAEILGVKPWEVEDVNEFWIAAAVTKANAEAWAERERARIERNRRRR
jgi:hypothetical protein